MRPALAALLVLVNAASVLPGCGSSRDPVDGGGVDTRTTPGEDASRSDARETDSGGATAIMCFEGDHTCSCGRGVGTAPSCTAADYGSNGVCCAAPGWPGAGDAHCTCGTFRCQNDSGRCFCDFYAFTATDAPFAACDPDPGYRCCSQAGLCECIPDATCRPGFTEVPRCDATTVICAGALYASRVSQCSP